MAIEIDSPEPSEPIEIPGMDINPVILIEKQTAMARQMYDASLRPIESEEDFVWANDELGEIKSRYNEVEALRVKLTKPLLDTKRNIDTLFKKPLKYLSDAESAVKAAIAKFLHAREEESKAAEDRRKAALSAATTEEEAAEAAALAVPEAPKAEGLSVASISKCEVVDFFALIEFVAKDPANYWECLRPNMTHIASLEGQQIPGVKFWKEKSVRRRTK